MNIATLIGLTFVASVFVIAAGSKLMTPTSTARAYRELRWPRLFRNPAAVAVLGVVEIVVGLALVLAADRPIVIASRLTALVLALGMFVASIRRRNANRADRVQPGGLGSVPTRAPAIIRNGALLVCSAFLAIVSFLEPPSTLHRFALPALGVVLGVTIIVRMRPRLPTFAQTAGTSLSTSIDENGT